LLTSIKKAVFIGAHTDDEFIAAGTLYRLATYGTRVYIITLAPAAIQSDRTGGDKSSYIVVREWHQSMDLIGVGKEDRHFLSLTPSSDLHPFRQRICQYVYDFCEKEKPDIAFILSPEDENTAHSIVGIESERVMRGRVPTTIRCQFPWNFGIGRPNLYVKLNQEELRVKQAVINAYQSQKFRYNYEEMLLHYAYGNGLSVKAEAAESFEIIRAVI
jgi:hypothetical protein